MKKQFFFLLIILTLVMSASFSFAGQADRLFADSSYEAALREYEQDVDFYKEVSIRYLNNPVLFNQYTAYLIYSYERIGDCYRALGDRLMARDNYRIALYYREQYGLLGYYTELFQPVQSLESKIISCDEDRINNNSAGYQRQNSDQPEESSDNPENNGSNNVAPDRADEHADLFNRINNYNSSSNSSTNRNDPEILEESRRMLDTIDQQLGLENRNYQPQSSYNINDFESLMICTESTPEFAEALLQAALEYEEQGNYSRAFSLLEKRLDLITLYEADSVIAENYFRMGIYKEQLHSYEQAIPLFEEALNLHLANNDPGVIGPIYFRIGWNMLNAGRLYSAVSVLESSINPLTQAGLESSLAETYFAIGMAYESLGQFEDAITSYEFSLEINNNLGNDETSGLIHYQMSEVFLKEDRPERALWSLQESVRYLEVAQSQHVDTIRGRLHSIETMLNNGVPN